MCPKVSVVIPVYNIEAHLQQCLDSVVDQTLREIEIICVDDGSTDHSASILDKYANTDGRFRIVHQSNCGPGAARNCGLTMGQGKYLIFLDSDDWFEPNFLAEMVFSAEQTRADITICRAEEFDAHTGKTYSAEWMLKQGLLPGTVFSPQEITPWVFQFTYGMAWDKLYRTAFLRENELRFPDLRNSEDLVFTFPSILMARAIGILDRVLIHHRINRIESVSNSRTQEPDAPFEAFNMVKEFLEKRQLMALYEQSFMNWAMEFLVWHVSNIGDTAIQRTYLKRLKKEWFPQLRFELRPRSYYRDRSTYLKYLLAKFFPFCVFRMTVNSYKQIKKLLQGG